MDTWMWTNRPTIHFMQSLLPFAKSSCEVRNEPCNELYYYMDVSCVTPTCAWLVAFNTGTVYIAFVPRGSQFGANTMPTQSLLSAHEQRILASLFLCLPLLPCKDPPPSLNCCFSQKDSWGGWSHDVDCGISSASGYLWLRGLTWLQAEVM